MSINVYKVGEAVTLKADFEVGGKDADPGSVVLTITDPNGTVSTPAATKDATGRYHYLLDLTAATVGVWNVNWKGTSPAQSVKDRNFRVEAVQ
jgi:hypothetical protein